jgi:hypothetical protein
MNDDELAAVIAAAVALLARREPAGPPPLSRWRLADRIGADAARSASPKLRSRWAQAGRPA